MKQRQFLFSILVVFAGITSCKKGEDIKGTGFGELRIASTFSGDVPPILIQVDGQTRDTLTTALMTKTMILEAGDRKIQLVNQQTKAVLTDTTLSIKAAQTTILPNFLYFGNATLFDDLTAKPDRDSMLVRLVVLDPALPDEMDFTFNLYDFGSINSPLAGKKLYGVRKDKFSAFIQLPDPYIVFPDAGFLLYAVEGYKAGTNEKVLDIDLGTYTYIMTANGTFFERNGVVSMGIGPFQNGGYPPVPIFTRIAE